MFNVGRLVNLICGVDSDGIIKDQEALILEEWISRNRAIAADQKEKRLVDLVDRSLSNGVVTSAEKKEILDCCEQCRKSNLDADSLFELAGMIERGLANENVGEEEVRSLSRWIDDNSGLSGNPTYDYAKRKIYAVLDDNAVTSKEACELLLSLRDRLKDLRVAHWVKRLRRRIEDQDLMGLDLIEIIDDDDIVKYIHESAMFTLEKALRSYSHRVTDKEIVFISASLIGLLNYDSAFYDSVEETYGKLYDRFAKPKIEGMIRDVLRPYLNKWDDDHEGRIIDVALSNALVPKHYLPAFFDFVFDIYKLNFDYTLSDDVEDGFRFAFEGLHEKMVNGKDNLAIAVTNKDYKLIQTTKAVIANSDTLEDMVQISVRVATIIDDHFWGQKKEIKNSYFKYGYDSWAKSLADEGTVRNGQKRNAGFRSSWKPQFEFTDAGVYLVPPEHRIKAEYDYRLLKASVYCGDDLICDDCIVDLREIIGGYRAVMHPVKLENPLGDVRYVVSAGDAIIYDSKAELHRSMLVFDVDNNELRDNTDFDGTVIICAPNGTLTEAHWHNDWYCMAVKNVRVGDTIVCGSEVFSFSSLAKPGIQGVVHERCWAENTAGQLLPVYRQVDCCVFEDIGDSEKYEIRVSGKSYHLKDLDYVVHRKQNSKRFVVDMKGLVQPGVASVAIIALAHGLRKNVWSSEFMYDPGLVFRQSDVDVDSDAVYVSVESDVFAAPVKEEIRLSDYDDSWLKFFSKGQEYIYRLNWKFDLYRLDEGPWLSFGEEIWGGDIKPDSCLDIFGFEYSDVAIASGQEKILQPSIPLSDKGFFGRLPFGFMVSFKEAHESVAIRLQKYGTPKKKIICRYKCTLDQKDVSFEFDPIERKLLVTWSYLGKGRVNLVITREGSQVGSPIEAANKGCIRLSLVKSFQTYSFSFVEKGKGLSFRKDREICCIKRMFCAWDDLVGRELCLDVAKYDKYHKGKETFVRRSLALQGMYVKFTQRIKDDIYRGFLLRKQSDVQVKLEGIGEVEIEICTCTEEGFPILSITKNGDGLLLYEHRQSVLNGLSDRNAPDIISFVTKLG